MGLFLTALISIKGKSWGVKRAYITRSNRNNNPDRQSLIIQTKMIQLFLIYQSHSTVSNLKYRENRVI